MDIYKIVLKAISPNTREAYSREKFENTSLDMETEVRTAISGLIIFVFKSI
jgi:hypothetical protein